jgi:glycosyltransferase involved in cell wall biosynthesis
MRVKKVLIAHQSTIPHYRVPFYEAVERLRPKSWEFSVIYDATKARAKSLLTFDYGSVNFHIKPSQTYTVRFAHTQLSFQTFLREGSKYDLLIMGSELNNLSYPLCYLWRFHGRRVAYWGHGRDSSVENARGIKAIAEQTKIWLTRRADGFFAYTNRVRDYMTSNGVERNKIFVLHNTIDIASQRSLFDKLIPERERRRSEAGLNGKKVLLYVGRLAGRKRLNVLFDAFHFLRRTDESYFLIIVGDGNVSLLHDLKGRFGERSFRYVGAHEDISQFCIISDLYVLPGAIGLGPLHALCFDLTPVVIHSRVHGPEYEYLNCGNALILPEGSTAEQYALAIKALLEDGPRWANLRAHAWPSIKHLTIENMALNFIEGVNWILQRQNKEVPNALTKPHL